MGLREWDIKRNFWLDKQFQALDIEDTFAILEKLSKSANICVKELEANPNARAFKTAIENFKNVFQTVQGLRDPAMTEEAWQEVRELIEEQGLSVEPFHELANEKYTVRWIETYNIHSVKE